MNNNSLERERQRKAYEASATADALNQIYTSGNMVIIKI